MTITSSPIIYTLLLGEGLIAYISINSVILDAKYAK